MIRLYSQDDKPGGRGSPLPPEMERSFRERIRKALERLSPRHRSIYEAVEDGRTEEEVAEDFGLDPVEVGELLNQVYVESARV